MSDTEASGEKRLSLTTIILFLVVLFVDFGIQSAHAGILPQSISKVVVIFAELWLAHDAFSDGLNAFGFFWLGNCTLSGLILLRVVSANLIFDSLAIVFGIGLNIILIGYILFFLVYKPKR